MIQDSGQRKEEITGALSDPSNAEIAAELLSPYALQQLAMWLGKGAKKYTPRNWEKGILFSVCIGKLLRHLFKYEQGLKDEDHLAAIGFWWHALSHYEAMIEKGLLPKNLDDLPKYEQSKYCNISNQTIITDKAVCVVPANQKITKIYLDMDDVLVDLTPEVCEKLDKPYRLVNFSGNYFLEKVLDLPCEPGEMWKHYEHTFDENFWANLSFTDDAFIIIEAVEKIINAKNIYLLSKPTGIKGCLEGKQQWINKYLPHFSDKVIFTRDKSSIATPNSLLIDDSDKQVDSWRFAGGQAILYPRPWNRRWKEANTAFDVFRKELKKYNSLWCPQTINVSP